MGIFNIFKPKSANDVKPELGHLAGEVINSLQNKHSAWSLSSVNEVEFQLKHGTDVLVLAFTEGPFRNWFGNLRAFGKQNRPIAFTEHERSAILGEIKAWVKTEKLLQDQDIIIGLQRPIG